MQNLGGKQTVLWGIGKERELGFCCLALFFCLMFDFFKINAAYLSFLFTNQSSSFQLLLPSNERKKFPNKLRTRFSLAVYY